MASNKRVNKAYVRYDGSGRVISGSLILNRFKPKVGNWSEIPAYECCNSNPVLLSFRLLFDNISNANLLVGDASSVSDWNTFFDLPAYGSPFTSVEVVGNEVRLFGGSDIIVKQSLFGDSIYGVNLIEVVDEIGCIIELEYNVFGEDNEGYGCENLTTVSLPNCLTAGSYCFSYCNSLINLNLPLLTNAGNNCFASCTSLTNTNWLSLTTIGSGSFSNTGISSLNLPLITVLTPGIFAGLVQLTSIDDITCPALVNPTSLPDFCFYNCTSLTEINFPQVQTAGGGCFSNCTGLTSISLPILETAGNECFQDCTSLPTIDLPLLVSTGNGCFLNCNSLTTVDLPQLVTAGEDCFQDCTSLTTIDLPLLQTAGSNCFGVCTSLTTIDLPQLVTAGSSGFRFCTSLTTIDLPLLTTAGVECFGSCPSMTTVNLPLLVSVGDTGFRFNALLNNISLPSCTNLGSTIGNNNVFDGISGNNITLTVPSALMTCNVGSPDGDIVYLQANNTVTVITV